MKRKIPKKGNSRFVNITTITVCIILLLLFIKNAKLHSEFVFDIIASSFIILFFYKFYSQLNQDKISYSFLLFALILHNLGIYATNPFGIRFDHYMHFIGGFTLAIVWDRVLNERLTRPKRFLLVILLALGIGALGELFEWIGYGTLGTGDGFFFYGIGDEGEWRNSMLDIAFNSLGATTFAVSMFLKRQITRAKHNFK